MRSDVQHSTNPNQMDSEHRRIRTSVEPPTLAQSTRMLVEQPALAQCILPPVARAPHGGLAPTRRCSGGRRSRGTDHSRAAHPHPRATRAANEA